MAQQEKISTPRKQFARTNLAPPPPTTPNKTPRLQSSAPKTATSAEPPQPPPTTTFSSPRNSKFWREPPPSQSEPQSDNTWPAEVLIGGRLLDKEDHGLEPNSGKTFG